MMDDQRTLELSRLYVAERIAAAEKEYLLRSFGRRRSYRAECAAWVGSALVRAGRRLEAIGGASQSGPSFDMRQRAI
jgi:hypothetical protein